MTFRKYLVLAAVAVFATTGDLCLKLGMNQAGQITIGHLDRLFLAIFNPWVAIGIVLLVGFFASYLTALSWADLTYVLPATALGYVLVALSSKFILHEHVSLTRWLGILLISLGVGFVAHGPSRTVEGANAEPVEANAKAAAVD